MLNKSKLSIIKEDLLKYVHQKNNYSYKSIMLKTGIDNNDDFYYVICKILKNFIDDFNFETPANYNKYINKLVSYLQEKEVYLEHEKTYIKKINNVKEDILIKIDKNNSKTEVALENEKFLMNLYHGLNDALNIISYGQTLTFDNDVEAYNIIKEMIFKLTKPNYIDELLKKCPDIIYLKNNNKYLFEELCDKYFNILLNKDDDNELIYYDKIINSFIINSNNNDDFKNIILYRTNKLLTSIENRDIDKHRLEKILFYIKNLDNNFVDHRDKYDIEKLHIKYNLQKLKETEKYRIVKPEWKDYQENNKYILSFDDPETNIFENALSLEIGQNGIIHLAYYISDISSYLKENEALKDKIYDNTFSIKGFPLLPKELKNKVNLKQGKKRKVIAFIFEFDRYLNVLDFKIEKQNISVKYNLSFSDLKNILKYPEDSKLKVTASNLYKLSQCILSNKQIEDINMDFGDKNIGSIMINNYQVYLNYFISNYCYSKDLPFIYRNNELGKEIDAIKELKEKYSDNVKIGYVFDLINNTNSSWYYSIDNKGHDGLKLGSYTEITRPTRSLASIINQDLIIKYFIDKEQLTEEEKIKLNNYLNKMTEMMNEKTVFYNNYLYEIKKLKRKK